MTWLTENPAPIFWTALAAEAVLVVALYQTQRAVYLLGMLGVLLVGGGLLLAEHLIVTKREQVELALDEIATALVNDDRAGVIERIDPASASARNRADAALRIFKVSTAKIGSDLTITLNQLTSPPSAKASFTGRLDLQQRRSGYEQTAVRRFTLVFVREGERWYLADYGHGEAGLR